MCYNQHGVLYALEADYAEDLYANWLGREFAKMYPAESPHELFASLAPKGFDIEQSKKSIAELVDTGIP